MATKAGSLRFRKVQMRKVFVAAIISRSGRSLSRASAECRACAAVGADGASADVLAMATTEVDISKVQPGQGIKVSWRKQPVFVRNLMPKEIAEANAVKMSELRDPQTLAQRTKPGSRTG